MNLFRNSHSQNARYCGGGLCPLVRHIACGRNRVKAATVLFFLVACSCVSGNAAIAPAGFAGVLPLPAHLFQASPILADAMPLWLDIAIAIIMLVATLGSFIMMLVNRKQQVQVQQPVEVTISEKLHDVFVSKEDFRKLEHKVDRMEREINGKLADLIEDGEERKDAILTKMSANTSALHTRINDIAEKMPERIVNLLRSMGIIK